MHVSKSVVIGFACALVASLMTIAYLIGRDQGRHRTEPIAIVPTPAPVATNADPSAPPPPPPPSAAVSAPMPVSPTTPTTAVTATPPPAPGDGAAVQAYFMRIDALGGGMILGDNAQDVAERLLASAVSGDMSGFDGVIKMAENAAAAARATSVPSSCAHFHQELLAMLDESLKLMTGLKDAIARNDTNALTSIGLSANGIQAHASALQAEEKQIKARFGLH